MSAGSISVSAADFLSQPCQQDVKFLRWPHDDDLRTQFSESRIPRLLVIEAGAAPPLCLDALEDWVRQPISKEDLHARTAALRSRALVERVPQIDANDVLRVGQKWIALSASEIEVMDPLVAGFRNVVFRSELAKQVWGSDSRERRNALDLRILRLRRRIEAVNLAIVTVWRKGYLLDSIPG